MSNRDIFSKHLPNVKLATRYDADGKEIQVERREDVDATACEEETFDILVAAGYYRAKIKGLSAFDKVVGGMTWCIECCDYDVDVDLLFHESLTIGQKIALVEKIVSVLPQMKCPFRIEPHQIQGLEFISIHPVIQWLVKRSVENRAERSQKLKNFAIGQFHNNYQYQCDKEKLLRIRNASANIKRIKELHNSPCRQYRRKNVSNNDAEDTRVRLTLLEYGDIASAAAAAVGAGVGDVAASGDEAKIDVEQLLRNLNLTKEDITRTKSVPINLWDEEERNALREYYLDLKHEMETDTKTLSEETQQKFLQQTALKLEKKVERARQENAELLLAVEKAEELLDAEQQIERELMQKIKACEEIETQMDSVLLNDVQSMLRQHDELKKQEAEFKEQCRQDLAKLQEQVNELEDAKTRSPAEQAAMLAREKLRVQELKLQLAKKNRGIVAIQRQLDNTPDRTELAQYQRRFHELYNEMSAKHLETKKYYTLYNTLNDKKRYMEKELSLLNSICETFSASMQSAHGREEFLQQFESIVEGVQQTRQKVQRQYNIEQKKRDALNDELQSLLELRRQYAAAVKRLTEECQRCQQLQQYLKSIQN